MTRHDAAVEITQGCDYYSEPEAKGGGDMIVLSPETEHLARLIAERSGKTPERVLDDAVEACAREVGIVPPREPPRNHQLRGKPSVDRITAISDRFEAYPVLDDRSPDDIIGYDEFGVPH
jgi:antitoxin VapB